MLSSWNHLKRVSRELERLDPTIICLLEIQGQISNLRTLGLEGSRSPGMPIDRIVGMLKQIKCCIIALRVEIQSSIMISSSERFGT